MYYCEFPPIKYFINHFCVLVNFLCSRYIAILDEQYFTQSKLFLTALNF